MHNMLTRDTVFLANNIHERLLEAAYASFFENESKTTYLP